MTITQSAFTLACVWASVWTYVEIMLRTTNIALRAVATFSIVSLLIYMLPAVGH
jgi:hypothetical protein